MQYGVIMTEYPELQHIRPNTELAVTVKPPYSARVLIIMVGSFNTPASYTKQVLTQYPLSVLENNFKTLHPRRSFDTKCYIAAVRYRETRKARR